MNESQLREAILDALAAVAPEAGGVTLDPAFPLRDQLEMDSMDQLNFMVGISERLGVEVPERDYRELLTLDDAVAYVGRALQAQGGS
ncbi:MAG: acyl carrier protein [Planctomycetota bacterium]